MRLGPTYWLMLYEMWWRGNGTRMEGGVLLQKQRRVRSADFLLTILSAICWRSGGPAADDAHVRGFR